MSVYNLNNSNFLPIEEKSGILQNMTSSNIEYVVVADGEQPLINTGIVINPSKKLKFFQDTGVGYIRIMGNTTGVVVVTPNDEGIGGGGKETIIYNNVKDWLPNVNYTKDTLVIYNGKLYKCLETNNDSTFTPTKWQEIGGSGSITDWASNTSYQPNDIVKYGRELYVCKDAHTSSSSFANDKDHWEAMVDNKGNIIPDWKPKETYEKDEVVCVGNEVYRCSNPHIAKDSFDDDKADWILLSGPNNDIKPWVSGESYKVGQYVTYGNNLYECKADNQDIAFDVTKWQMIGGDSLNVTITDWESGTSYAAGDLVIYDYVLYQCVTANSDTLFDEDKWVSIGETNHDLQEWVSGQYYEVGNFAVYNDTLYKCTTANSDTTFDNTNWQEIGSTSSISVWESGTSYAIDDLVIYDDHIYQCLTANSDLTFDPTKWNDLGGINNSFISIWESGKSYKVDDIVIYKDGIYRCTSANSDITFDPTKWLKVISSDNSLRVWEANTAYKVNQMVVYNGNIYQCTTANQDATFDEAKWEMIGGSSTVEISTWQTGTMYKANQLVEYDKDLYMCINGHTSTGDDIALDYGSGNWLKVDNSILGYQKNKFYAKDSVIVYDGKLYRCKKSYFSTSDDIIEHIEDMVENNYGRDDTITFYYSPSRIIEKEIIFENPVKWNRIEMDFASLYDKNYAAFVRPFLTRPDDITIFTTFYKRYYDAQRGVVTCTMTPNGSFYNSDGSGSIADGKNNYFTKLLIGARVYTSPQNYNFGDPTWPNGTLAYNTFYLKAIRIYADDIQVCNWEQVGESGISTLPIATNEVLGGVKTGSNITNSNGTISLTKANVTSALGYTPPTTDTNTHYTTHLYAGSGTAANAATTNGNTKIALTDDSTVRNTLTVKGTGATTVTSDANGVITINSTDNNTTYSVATQSVDGLLSAADKKKLDGIDAYSLPTAKRSTAYSLGDTAMLENIPAGYFLECTTAGTTGATAPVITPPVSAGQTISDGTVVWTVRKALSTAGELTYSDGIFKRTNDTGLIDLVSGVANRSASILLSGQDRPGVSSRSVAYRSVVLDSGHAIDSDNQDTLNRLVVHPVLGIVFQKYDLNTNETILDAELGGSAIVAKSLGPNGYVKYADGRIIQWGFGTYSNTKVNFPISFTTTQLIFLQPTASSADASIFTAMVTQPSHSGFTAKLSGAANCSWLAIGY